MEHGVKRIIAFAAAGFFLLSCTMGQRLAMHIGGLQGQVDSLTNVANPVEHDEIVDATPTFTAEAATVEPPQEATPQALPSPTAEEDERIVGEWDGAAQWLCDNNQPWDLSMVFQRNGTVKTVLSGPGDSINEAGRWSLSGNKIEIQFRLITWVGTLDGSTIHGTFAEENCSGEWKATKK